MLLHFAFSGKPDVAAALCVPVFSGLDTRRLLRCAALHQGATGRVDHTGRGGVELSKLSSGDAFLVQPVLGHVWSGRAASICGSAPFAVVVCGGRVRGVSILIKVIGAYYIAGVLLFLVFVEQSDVASDDQSNPKAPKAGENAIPYRIFSTGALLLFWRRYSMCFTRGSEAASSTISFCPRLR